MRIKPDRAHYIRPDMTEERDPESTAVAYLSASSPPVAVMFSGRRQKPDSNFRYRSEERRAEAVAEHFANVRRAEAYQAERRATVKAARNAESSLEFVGKDYLPAPAVAALLRQCLKESFPGQRFSVRSDGSLNVSWTDGPAVDQVDRIAGTFAGSYFDGQIDYKGSLYHQLDGRRVSFGCDFVFCRREFSREALEAGAEALRAHYKANAAPATIEGESPYWQVKVNPDFAGAVEGRFPGESVLILPRDNSTGCRITGEGRHALGAWFDTLAPVAVQPSPTFARIAVLGSDGYGNTIDTPEGKPAGAGYPSHERKDIAEARPEAEAVQPSADVIDFAAPRAQVVADEAEQAADLLELMARTARRFAEEARPRAVACEVIDFAPHLIARANDARRVN